MNPFARLSRASVFDRSGVSCIVCETGQGRPHRTVGDVPFFTCDACGSVFAEPEFIARVERGEVVNYRGAYWDSELQSANERSYGSTLLRVAETFRMCRIPITRFIDIGTGSGALLDAIDALVPELSSCFHGIELFPPAPDLRSRHPNYRIGTLADTDGMFEAGICIEVIEHMSPATVRTLGEQLARRSKPGSLYFFNSAQPSFVRTHDPAYLDPLGRGHIVSYSVAGATHLLGPSGFDVIELPGRDWAFLAEFVGPKPMDRSGIVVDQMFERLWHPLEANMTLLRRAKFGPLMIGMGLESARCYLEHATAEARTAWALQLNAQLDARLDARVHERANP